MTKWHKLSLVSALTLIVPTLVAGCGGMSAEDGKGNGGSSGSASGGQASANGGASSQGGSTSGGQAQGGAVSCGELGSQYAAAADEAQSCNPALSVEQCTQKVPIGLACNCPGFVNPQNTEAIAKLAQIQLDYERLLCRGGIACGPCLEPIRAVCSPAGRCEPAVTTSTGKSCKVDGVVYPDGAEGIPDPASCNKCSCVDGSLACTEIFCPKACPAGSLVGSQCVQCGPAGGCAVVGYGCVPTCTSECAEPGKVCEGGLCLNPILCF